MDVATADLWDQYPDRLRVVEPIFRDFGALKRFYGEVVTVDVFEDNVLVRETLEQQGDGRVLVVEGSSSLRCALVGDRLAQLAKDNGWRGVVLNGCIRDSATIATLSVGLKALNVSPVKSIKRGEGHKNVQVHFGGVTINPGDYIYADEDGILVASEDLTGS